MSATLIRQLLHFMHICIRLSWFHFKSDFNCSAPVSFDKHLLLLKLTREKHLSINMCTQNSRLLLILLVVSCTTVFTIISNSLAAKQDEGFLSIEGVRFTTHQFVMRMGYSH